MAHAFSPTMPNGRGAYFHVGPVLGREEEWDTDQQVHIRRGSEDDMAMYEWQKPGIEPKVDFKHPHLNTIDMSNLEDPVSRGEYVDRDADWDTLYDEYKQCTNHAERMKFFATHLQGAFTVGCVTDGDQMIPRLKEGQADIDAILDDPTNLDKTGEELGLLCTPGVLCGSPHKKLMINSGVLTRRDINNVDNTVQAHGPADLVIFYVPRQNKEGDFVCLHFELAIIPKDPRDGKALLFAIHWAYTEKENPLARRYLLDRFNVQTLGAGPLTSPYSLMVSRHDGEIINGRPSVILSVREDDWHYNFGELIGHEKANHAHPALGQDYGRFVTPAKGVALWPNITTEQHSRILGIEALAKIALQRGEVPRGGMLTPSDSCGALAGSILALALPASEFSHLDAHTIPLDRLAVKLMSMAPKHLWAKENMKPRTYQFLHHNRDRFYEEISRDEAVKRTRRIIEDPAVFKRQPIQGMASWGNQWTMFREQHPNPKACELYDQSVIVGLDELKRRKGGNIHFLELDLMKSLVE